MKKISRLSITVFIVLCLLLVSFSTVFARRALPTITWTDPTASTSEKGLTFTSEVLDPWQLPGTLTLGTGQYGPVGFPAGQAQFGGNGLKVTALPEGKTVELCFDFPVYSMSWEGKIYLWNETKWVAMPTTVTPGSDGSPTYACTPKAANGIYALIIGFYGTPQPDRPR